ncbi:hypothetical protein [Asticcacaulis excentricus]|uniref:Secreted protein n=1 Tax=Asticcacaulis excentricus (strain ATCC 15261 / DSM 4724 / KCTC 12464 / NCIMB 9791 / VKM B-1370 / CB 48) TaxID=573065 RepID=E8RW39_ASTEC|nr:hypothetical protein [Asticcacaulis excentricus]ADU15461.1 hypothetical protein Astex_3854 [Asticcacaulis excentricus CB 48]
MRRKLPIVGAIGAMLMASLTATPVFAQAATQTTGPESDARKSKLQCMWEAKWPLRHSTAYRVGDVRTKNQIRNSSNTEVQKMQSVCRALTSTSEAEKRKARLACHDLLLVKRLRDGDDARMRADRVEAVCKTLDEAFVTPILEGNAR